MTHESRRLNPLALSGTHYSASLRDYVAIARPDHWFKNIFMLPGAALAFALQGYVLPGEAAALVFAVISTCLVTSANYTINEWLDAEFDRHHPNKKHRPSVSGRVKGSLVYLQWLALAGAGLALAAAIGASFALFSIALLVMGFVYNVHPLRTKDRQYLDVLSESINNPLRFLLGWAAIEPSILPPSSILLAYWMGGAYLMAIKRYSEFRFIGDPERAARYRRSFAYYTEGSLLTSAFFYALCSAFFLGVFLIKYRIEFLLTMPFLALLFTWYLHIGMSVDSVTQRPEKLYRERSFVAYVAALSLLIAILFFLDLPWLDVLVETHVQRAS
jgi:decaprenyl-phosphate phosphoribosyltransferase